MLPLTRGLLCVFGLVLLGCPTRFETTSDDGTAAADVASGASGTSDPRGTTASPNGDSTTDATDSASTGISSDDSEDGSGSAGGPDDPYGRCSRGCGWADASCLESEQAGVTFQMCSPPCSVESSPSTECPAPIGTGDHSVGCLSTGIDGMVSCFITCGDGESCPNGMVCASDVVCSWQ